MPLKLLSGWRTWASAAMAILPSPCQFLRAMAPTFSKTKVIRTEGRSCRSFPLFLCRGPPHTLQSHGQSLSQAAAVQATMFWRASSHRRPRAASASPRPPRRRVRRRQQQNSLARTRRPSRKLCLSATLAPRWRPVLRRALPHALRTSSELLCLVCCSCGISAVHVWKSEFTSAAILTP